MVVVLPESERNLFNVHVAFLGLALLAVALRFCARLKHRRAPLASDWVILVAGVGFVAYTGVVLGALANPYGTVEVTEIPNQAWNLFITKRLLINEYLSTLIITLAKLSLLLFYREIFSTPMFRLANNLVIGLALVWFIGCVGLLTLSCGTHVRRIWDFSDGDRGGCTNLSTVLIGYEVSNIFVDLCVFVLPMLQLRRVQLKLTRKVAVGCVFSLGGFVVVTSILRLSPIIKDPVANIPLTTTFIWTSVQCGSCILCSCLPTLFPLLPSNTSPQFTALLDRVFAFSSHIIGVAQTAMAPMKLYLCSLTTPFHRREIASLQSSYRNRMLDIYGPMSSRDSLGLPFDVFESKAGVHVAGLGHHPCTASAMKDIRRYPSSLCSTHRLHAHHFERKLSSGRSDSHAEDLEAARAEKDEFVKKLQMSGRTESSAVAERVDGIYSWVGMEEGNGIGVLKEVLVVHEYEVHVNGGGGSLEGSNSSSSSFRKNSLFERGFGVL